ncbi:MAG: ABC transporter ATP-binding protein [bacterium]|nr:MAG: ABC transporter ATP-binding protein [bacterium]
MSEIAVQTSGLTKKFGDFVAVDQVSIDVKRGEIFGFLGANGAGKTTMIRMLCGLLKPTSGEGKVTGLDLYAESERIKQKIGYMSQKFSLYNDLTLSENIDFYGGIYGLNPTDIEFKKNQLLADLQLTPWRDKLTGTLPPGFKQGLALGTAMLHDPSIVFLDEPTSGVDPSSRRAFWDVIYQTASRGITVFVTTHFMDEAEYCHRISIMSTGKIIALDRPDNLREKYKLPTIQSVFVHLMRQASTH